MKQEEPIADRRENRSRFLHSCVDGHLPQVIIIKGETGSGKTVLSKKLVHEWMSKERESAMSGFDLVLKVECQDRIGSIDQLLGQLLPNIKREKKFDFRQLLRQVKLKILFLVDVLGLNEVSEKLLSEILSLASNDRRVVCTTRPFQTNMLRVKVLEHGKTFMVINMAGVAMYSRNYFSKRLLDNLVSEYMNKEIREKLDIYFTSAGTWCQKHFVSPFNLTLLVLMHIYNPDSTDITGIGTPFFSQIEKFKIQKLVHQLMPKFPNLAPEEVKDKCLKVTKLLNQFAFESVKSGNSSLPSTALEKLDDQCTKLELSVGDVLSAFLMCKGQGYSFAGKTILDFRAASHVCYLLRTQPKLAPDCGGGDVDVVYFMIGLLAEKLPEVLATNTDLIVRQAESAGVSAPNEWLDLLHEAQCHPALTRAVGRVLDGKEKWAIRETHLSALTTLLQVASPRSLVLKIDSLEKDPEDIKELSDALRILATKPISLSLDFIYYFVMAQCKDSLLRMLIEDPKRRAVMQGYRGYISCSLMPRLPRTFSYLNLQVRLEELKSLAEILPEMKHLEILEVFLRGSRYKENLPILNFHSPTTKLIVDISGAHDKSWDWIERVMTSLSRRPYYKVKLFHSTMTGQGAIALQTVLNGSNITLLDEGVLEIRSSAHPTSNEERILEEQGLRFKLPVFFRNQ